MPPNKTFISPQGETLNQLVSRVCKETETGLVRPTRVVMEIRFQSNGTGSHHCSVLYAVHCAACGTDCGESEETQEKAFCSECRS